MSDNSSHHWSRMVNKYSRQHRPFFATFYHLQITRTQMIPVLCDLVFNSTAKAISLSVHGFLLAQHLAGSPVTRPTGKYMQNFRTIPAKIVSNGVKSSRQTFCSNVWIRGVCGRCIYHMTYTTVYQFWVSIHSIFLGLSPLTEPNSLDNKVKLTLCEEPVSKMYILYSHVSTAFKRFRIK